MKALIILISFCLMSACIQRIPDTADPIEVDTIIDPIIPYNFEIQYDQEIKITPDVFPKGYSGIGALRLFINRHSRIERFEIAFIRIRDKNKIIHNYISEIESTQTAQLDTIFRSFIKTIKVKRINDDGNKRLESYDIAVKFY